MKRLIIIATMFLCLGVNAQEISVGQSLTYLNIGLQYLQSVAVTNNQDIVNFKYLTTTSNLYVKGSAYITNNVYANDFYFNSTNIIYPDVVTDPVITPYNVVSAPTVTVLRAWGNEWTLLATNTVFLKFDTELTNSSYVATMGAGINPNGNSIIINVNTIDSNDWSIVTSTWTTNAYNDVIFRKPYSKTIFRVR